jgi:hypothetical protein
VTFNLVTSVMFLWPLLIRRRRPFNASVRHRSGAIEIVRALRWSERIAPTDLVGSFVEGDTIYLMVRGRRFPVVVRHESAGDVGKTLAALGLPQKQSGSVLAAVARTVLYIDTIWGVAVPYPLPAVGAKVRVTGRYASSFMLESSRVEVHPDPERGILTLRTCVTMELAPKPASFPQLGP